MSIKQSFLITGNPDVHIFIDRGFFLTILIMFSNVKTLYFTFPIYITPGLTWRGGLLVTGTGLCSARLNVSAEAEMSNVCVKIVCNTFLNFQLLFPPSQLFPVCFSLISPSFSGCWLPWPRPPCPGTASCGCRARGARNF